MPVNDGDAARIGRAALCPVHIIAQGLDLAEANPEKSFVRIAMELDLIDRTDADQLLHFQQLHRPSIRKLVVECGLLTQRQTSVLYLHFERNGYGVKTQVNENRPRKSAEQPIESPAEPTIPTGPRQPKFKARPVVQRPFAQSPAMSD